MKHILIRKIIISTKIQTLNIFIKFLITFLYQSLQETALILKSWSVGDKYELYKSYILFFALYTLNGFT